MKSIAHVGMDVHKEDIVAALYVGSESEPSIVTTIANDPAAVRKVFRRWDQHYELRCCYEASSCGYVLARWLSEMSIDCKIAAPSLIPVRPGDHYKTDRRDAKKLAKLYRAGELSFVRIPTEKEESVRSLVRCRETIRKELNQSRHYVLKFLQLRGLSYRGGRNWTRSHWRYLQSLKFEGCDATVWREYMCLLQYKQTRLEDLDAEIEEIAFSEAYSEAVGRLRCFRGIDVLSAMVLLTEVGDFGRFANPAQLMSFFGLAPGCHRSGATSHRCSITKAGNSRCRHVLVEAAWHYRHGPYVSKELQARQIGQSAYAVATSWKAQHRLHKKFMKLYGRSPSNKAAVAVARELSGFLWAALTLVPDTCLTKAA